MHHIAHMQEAFCCCTTSASLRRTLPTPQLVGALVGMQPATPWRVWPSPSACVMAVVERQHNSCYHISRKRACRRAGAHILIAAATYRRLHPHHALAYRPLSSRWCAQPMATPHVELVQAQCDRPRTARRGGGGNPKDCETALSLSIARIAGRALPRRTPADCRAPHIVSMRPTYNDRRLHTTVPCSSTCPLLSRLVGRPF